MNRANQEALFHLTNQQVVNIRQSEINYHLSLHVAFGTQAALIGGFTYGVFTQTPLNYEIPSVEYIADVYWIVSALTIAFAIHVVLVTMMLQVLGQGLALNGPIGSMAIAAVGMRIEQQQVTVSFMMMMLFFSLSTVLSFWVSMRIQSASVSTFIFIIAARYWFYYCQRIYLRFYWDAEASQWDRERANSDVHGDEGPTIATDNPMQTGGFNSNQVQERMGSEISSELEESNKKKKRSLLHYLFYRKGGRKRSDSRDTDARSRSDTDEVERQIKAQRKAQKSGKTSDLAGTLTGKLTLIHEGFLTVKGTGKHAIVDAKKPSVTWERRYFTLSTSALLLWYKTRQDFRSDPNSPMNTRPVSLKDFFVRIDNIDEERRAVAAAEASSEAGVELSTVQGEVLSDSGTSVGDMSAQGKKRKGTTSTKKNLIPYRFQIVLKPRDYDDHSLETVHQRREELVLRCDTEDELNIWVQQMKTVSPSSFGQDN